MNKPIVIIGAGPAGCALACMLAIRNIDCLVFDDDKKPELLVGESQISAVVPILRRLGIEDEVAKISTVKHGAAFRHGNGNRVDFRFRRFGFKYPDYSYNIPRPAFDTILRKRAEALGVRFVGTKAQLEATHNDPDRDIQLSEQSLAQAKLDRHNQPDLLIDATGRTRLFSRILALESTKGGRDDVSYFAHYENFNGSASLQGQAVLSVLDCGWSWQIPLKKALSVGVVLNKKTAKTYGSTPEQRLEHAINTNPILAVDGAHRKRITKVMSYSNYQLITKQGFGKGWLLLGDAFGFVDPLLSPGVFMSLKSAEIVDRLLFSQGHLMKDPLRQQSTARYADEIYQWHRSWNDLINYFYNGKLLSLANAKDHLLAHSGPLAIGRLAEPHISKVLASLVSGVKTRSKYNHAVLMHSCQHLLKDQHLVTQNAIKSQLTANDEATGYMPAAVKNF